LQALCDIGQTRLAMDTSGAASHSPQPDNAPGAHAHQQRILAAVADVQDLQAWKDRRTQPTRSSRYQALPLF
jgi:hypothetical protein